MSMSVWEVQKKRAHIVFNNLNNGISDNIGQLHELHHRNVCESVIERQHLIT